jgi:ferredoxin
MIAFLGHRHVHVDNAIACKGCRKCVAICPQQAVTLQCGDESRTSKN